MVKTKTITGDANHAEVQNLRGWSVVGTVVLRLRKGGLVTGDPIVLVNNDTDFLALDSFDAEGGCYVEVVSGSLTEGYLHYV